jgi:norsolorinic acid ketoreductase
MAPTTVLISGANRGLGRGLVERYLARDDHTVVAAVRDPNRKYNSAPYTVTHPLCLEIFHKVSV